MTYQQKHSRQPLRSWTALMARERKKNGKTVKCPPRPQSWQTSRAGARAGRGFRFQDLVAAVVLAEMWAGQRTATALIPEGWDDLTVVSGHGSEYIQVKSRQPHLGPIPRAEVAAHVVDGWGRLGSRLEAAGTTFTLVIEQPIESGGQEETPAAALADAIRRRVGADVEVADLLTRSRIRVLSNPDSTAATVLATRQDRHPGEFAAYVQALRTAAGAAADTNASSIEHKPAVISLTDVEMLMDDVARTTDPSHLVRAVASGICEPVDVSTPVNDPDFYRGLNVVPGHVAAGLVMDRPEIEDILASELADGRTVLITGPSGAGKSSALYLTAYRDRSRRWYRVRRLKHPDVGPVVDLARGLRPGQYAPIGFLVDDVGRPSREGFDDLAEALAHIPGVAVVGAARVEDLFTVRNLGRMRLVPLQLDAGLAASMFDQLRARQQTSWLHWKEPFDSSAGLMLEFVHTLTQGERLSAVIADQVRARSREGRHDELAVLAVAGTATAWDVTVPVRPLARATGLTESAMTTALERLVGEHLFQWSEDGSIGGLHRLRSRAVFDAIHRVAPPTQSSSVAQVVEVLPASELQPFLVGLLIDRPDLALPALAALAERLQEAAELDIAAAGLQACRLADFHAQAGRWLAVFADHDVPYSLRSVTANLALMGRSLGTVEQLLHPAIGAALQAVGDDDSESSPRRNQLVQNAAGALGQALEATTDLDGAARLLASLAGCPPAAAEFEQMRWNDTALASALARGDIDDVGQVIATASEVSLALGRHMLRAAGGEHAVSERIVAARPWVRKVRIGTAADGYPGDRADDLEDVQPDTTVVRAEYRYISDLVEADARSECVSLCRQLLAALPDVEVARVVCVDARGELHGFGDLEVANLRLRRNAVPSKSAVAWNRARLRIVDAALVTGTRPRGFEGSTATSRTGKGRCRCLQREQMPR